MSHLLDRVEALQVVRERTYQDRMRRLREVRAASSREVVERAVAARGLRPVTSDQLVVLSITDAER